MKYIDFDGVILDTESLMFHEKSGFWQFSHDEQIEYVKNQDWMRILNQATVIKDAINILKELDAEDTAILTKVHSLNEADAKINYLRDNGVKQSVILVPYKLSKIDVVPAIGNILVDNAMFNLDEWKKSSGIPIFFNKDDEDIDEYGIKNENYPKIKTLRFLNHYK